MLHDLQQGLPPLDLHADVLVVGAGAAGIALTVELARLGKRVVLLEGGGTGDEPASQALYQTELSGLAHRGAHEGRFRVHGGTTTQWGGQILELDDSDFAAHSWIPGSGWPICKADLAPFYARALEIEGLSGSLLQDDEVWRALKVEQPSLQDVDLYLSRWCPEPNFARLHRRVLESHPCVDTWLHANAVELLCTDHHATGVRCRSLTGNEFVFRANTYIFALGTIESSRFFLQPRPDGRLPWNQSGLLGCHFQDHIDADAATIHPHSAQNFHDCFDSIFLHGYKYNPKLRLTRDAQRRAQTLIAGGTIFSSSLADNTLAAVKTTAKHLLQGRLGEVSSSQMAGLVRNAPLVWRQSYRYAVQHRSFHPADAEVRLRVHCEQEPLSSSRISLSRDVDSLGMLRARLQWQISTLELETIRAFVQTMQHALTPLAGVIAHPALAQGSLDDFRNQCQDSFHHMGGMRMDPCSSRGVVDTNLRLHNMANVYACTSAIYPTSGFSNPTHTLLALAMRLANHLSHTD